MADWGSALGAFGGGIQDFFAASGHGMAAGDLDRAARAEETAAKIARGSTIIQHAAATRSIERAIGGQRSDIGGAGFEFTGTAVDMAADSAGQGAIAQALIENQGAIDVQGHQIAAANYRGQAAQERNAQSGSTLGGVLNIGLGILGLFSDRRLKENIVKVGVDADGKFIYEFNYKGVPQRFRGFVAQELNPEDVNDVAGFLGVDIKHRAEMINA